jgi:hypothetical protein
MTFVSQFMLISITNCFKYTTTVGGVIHDLTTILFYAFIVFKLHNCLDDNIYCVFICFYFLFIEIAKTSDINATVIRDDLCLTVIEKCGIRKENPVI